jgi:hypothetical protein
MTIVTQLFLNSLRIPLKSSNSPFIENLRRKIRNNIIPPKRDRDNRTEAGGGIVVAVAITLQDAEGRGKGLKQWLAGSANKVVAKAATLPNNAGSKAAAAEPLNWDRVREEIRENGWQQEDGRIRDKEPGPKIGDNTVKKRQNGCAGLGIEARTKELAEEGEEFNVNENTERRVRCLERL